MHEWDISPSEPGAMMWGMDDPVHIPELLAEKFGVSRSEARRVLAMGGVRLNGWTLRDMDVDAQNLAGAELQVGKRRSVTLD